MSLTELRERVRVRRGLPPPDERRALREAASISQVELAQYLGCTSAAISYFEAGKREPRGRLRELYIQALEILREAQEGGGP